MAARTMIYRGVIVSGLSLVWLSTGWVQLLDVEDDQVKSFVCDVMIKNLMTDPVFPPDLDARDLRIAELVWTQSPSTPETVSLRKIRKEAP